MKIGTSVLQSRLSRITFTGIDKDTFIEDLCRIQGMCPIAEFGFLYSYKWQEKGNRYPNPAYLKNLRGYNLNLSLHLCGQAAEDAANCEWDKIDDAIYGNLNLFHRVQLNIANRNNVEVVYPSPIQGQEIIIQQRDIDHLNVYNNTRKLFPQEIGNKVSVLLDASGGEGKDTIIQILSLSDKVGYAGGFNDNNIANKLRTILLNQIGYFWIDMETGVRTGDVFDINKVERIVRICVDVLLSLKWTSNAK